VEPKAPDVGVDPNAAGLLGCPKADCPKPDDGCVALTPPKGEDVAGFVAFTPPNAEVAGCVALAPPNGDAAGCTAPPNGDEAGLIALTPPKGDGEGAAVNPFPGDFDPKAPEAAGAPNAPPVAGLAPNPDEPNAGAAVELAPKADDPNPPAAAAGF